MEQFLKLVEELRGSHIYIQTHNFPDPDAIASAFGLQNLLLHFDISSTLVYVGKIDRLNTRRLTKLFNIEIHSYDSLKGEITEHSKIICVDSQKYGGNIENFVGEEIACIDHHPTYKEVDYQYMDVRIVGSCATLISEYYKKLNIEMSEDVATALLYGLKIDTLHFQRGVTPLDIEMFGYLFPRIYQKKLDILEKNTMEMADLRAFSAVIDSIELYNRNGFAKIPFACPDAMIATISDFILSLEEIDVAIVYSYRSDGIKFSVRSVDPQIHAGNLVRNALEGVGNGGGHAVMAGGFISRNEQEKMGPYPDTMIKEYFLNQLSLLLGEAS